MSSTLDGLDQRIAAALQVDGRAPWRKIAAVLGEPERSVARRGNDLLASGAVAVVGILTHAESAVLRIRCNPGTARMTTEALAQRPDCNFSYMTTGSAECVAELMFDAGLLAQILGSEIPATVGLHTATSYPVLRYFRTIRGWRSGVLTRAEAAALASDYPPDDTGLGRREAITAQDAAIAAVLSDDGRASFDEIARRAGISETTASRRTDWLLRTGNVQLRALVEPSLVGLPVEAVLWIRAEPRSVERIGAELAGLREVRYAAALAGDCQLVANVTVTDNAALYRFTTGSSWASLATSVDTSVLLGARKRGGRMLPI